MPRVSESHAAARRRQIADAAARCFARDGFHATSMQRVIAEAGLSAGAVYRYFPSKAALIQHIATDTLDTVATALDEAAIADPPPPLEQTLDRLLTAAEPYVDSRLRIAVQIWGEALRSPELAEIVAELYERLLRRLTEVARRLRESGQLGADSDDRATARALFGLLQGYIVQRVVLDNPDRAQYLSGLRALRHRALETRPRHGISPPAAAGSR
ncbi:MAG: TetR/AcrR family transcriptional regulator [Micromonosporaceae bacterium]